ncbi:replicative DNA helicase [Pseudomonas delhiensis]|uniref:replicative DNA helicase n=1 Tax=Pseudomonas delhiensis TaxID=366289 RepID=UPI00315AD3A0
MRDLYAIEAEHGVLGAMMQRPDLIDILSDDLSAEAFYFAENAEVYRSIMAVRSEGKGVDFLTVAEHLNRLPSGDSALAYCCEIVKNTPSVANASTYARIVRERAIDRALWACGNDILTLAQSEQSTQDKVSALHAMAMSVDAGGSAVEVVKASDVLVSQVEVWQHRHNRRQNGETLLGLSTGLKDLDQKIGGLQPEQLVIVAGRPAMGKTTLAMGFAINAAVNLGKSALVVSLEMSNGQLIDRAVAAQGRIPLSAIKDGSAIETHGESLSAATHRIHKSNLYFADLPGANINRVRSMARRHKLRYGLDILVIDYLQLMDGEGSNRVEAVGGMSRGAKLLARELGIPVVLLSQLSRQCEQRPNKRPINSDLRESGAIEQDADVILFVYRDEVYNEHSEFKGVAEIIAGKARDGETGTVRAAFLGQYNRFEDLSAEWRPIEDEQSKVTSLASRYAKGKGGAQ